MVALSNSRLAIRGAIAKAHLGAYLDEYSFRINCRRKAARTALACFFEVD
jgi:hypothetical protein